jgi:hypothetical protein
MDHTCVSWTIRNRAELLEAFNCILDVLGVPDADGDVFEAERGLTRKAAPPGRVEQRRHTGLKTRLKMNWGHRAWYRSAQ